MAEGRNILGRCVIADTSVWYIYSVSIWYRSTQKLKPRSGTKHMRWHLSVAFNLIDVFYQNYLLGALVSNCFSWSSRHRRSDSPTLWPLDSLTLLSVGLGAHCHLRSLPWLFQQSFLGWHSQNVNKAALDSYKLCSLRIIDKASQQWTRLFIP